MVNDGFDKGTRPTHVKGESMENLNKRLEKYDKRNDAAHATLLAGISEDLHDFFSACVLKPRICPSRHAFIERRFDHETTTISFLVFKKYFEIRSEEGRR